MVAQPKIEGKLTKLFSFDASADAQGPADFEDAVALGPQLANACLHSRFDPETSAQLGAVGPGPRKPGVDTFANDAALKFAENAQHLKHCLASGSRCVEALLMQEQIDALVVQALQDAEEIRQRSPEAVNRPGGNHVELFGVDRLHHGVGPRPLVTALGATDAGIFTPGSFYSIGGAAKIIAMYRPVCRGAVSRF
jgi:hypothetical protein